MKAGRAYPLMNVLEVYTPDKFNCEINAAYNYNLTFISSIESVY